MFYSDNSVDNIISPHLPAFGYAVDVGANDGIFHSNTKHFEDKGWIVMCIEPNPRLEDAGRKNRKLWRRIACGRNREDNREFTIVGQYPHASFSGMHINEYPPAQGTVISGETISVRVETLDSILESSGFPRLDLLSIDAEGHEVEILKGINLNVWKPKIIVAEAWSEKIKSQLIELLGEFSYQLDLQCQLDCCFGRRI